MILLIVFGVLAVFEGIFTAVDKRTDLSEKLSGYLGRLV